MADKKKTPEEIAAKPLTTVSNDIYRRDKPFLNKDEIEAVEKELKKAGESGRTAEWITIALGKVLSTLKTIL